MKREILLLVLCLTLFSFACANKVELLNSGGDLNNTYTTIQACANVVSAGQTCLVYNGTYNEQIRLTRSGTATEWITFMAKDKRGVIIDGNNISSSVYTSTYRGLISLAGASYVLLDGFDVKNMISNMSNSGGLSLARSSGDHDITINNFKIYQLNTSGIFISGAFDNSSNRTSNITIKNSEIFQCSEHGILGLGGIDNILIENNTIHDNGYLTSANVGDGIFMGYWGGISYYAPINLIIRNNEMYNHPRKGAIFFNGIQNSLIEKNYIYGVNNFGVGLSGNYNGLDQINATIRNNIIITTTHFEGLVRFHQDGGDYAKIRDVNVYNNVLIETDNSSEYQHTIEVHSGSNKNTSDAIVNLSIKNNIIVSANMTPQPYYRMIYTENANVTQGFNSNYNLFYMPVNISKPFTWQGTDKNITEWIALGNDVNSVFNNPLFFNVSNVKGPDGILWTDDDGLRLPQDSPAIDAGINVGLPYLGNAPDIGAYEYETVQSLGICSAYPGERYSNEEISVQIVRWRSGEIDLREMIKRAKIWKYCQT